MHVGYGKMMVMQMLRSANIVVLALQYYAFVEEKQKIHCLNTLFSKVRTQVQILEYSFLVVGPTLMSCFHGGCKSSHREIIIPVCCGLDNTSGPSAILWVLLDGLGCVYQPCTYISQRSWGMLHERLLSSVFAQGMRLVSEDLLCQSLDNQVARLLKMLCRSSRIPGKACYCLLVVKYGKGRHRAFTWYGAR
jgi:hypothetical protein